MKLTVTDREENIAATAWWSCFLQMLKGIRVTSKEELANRIYLYFDEVNRAPVVYRWTYKVEEISVEEAVA